MLTVEKSWHMKPIVWGFLQKNTEGVQSAEFLTIYLENIRRCLVKMYIGGSFF